MASLKEIRGRITSITNTRKITSAMKMVSSAKLRRAQDALVRFYPYSQKISGIMNAYLDSAEQTDLIPLAQVRPVQHVAIVAVSSNSSLCGAFNNNVVKKINEVLKNYSNLRLQDIFIYVIGKKAYESLSKSANSTLIGPNDELANKPTYIGISKIADELIARFLANEIDRVELVYNEFKNPVVQRITSDTLLPLVVIPPKEKKQRLPDYIIEPNTEELLRLLAPTVVRVKLYGMLLNSFAAEHGARTTAMQTATDNANELIDSLTLQYNKVRQAAITKEILDIVGGAEALR